MIAAEMFNAANATGLVEEMKRRWNSDPVGAQRCWSAKPRSAAPNYRLDEACLSFTERDIPALFQTSWAGQPFFTADSIDSSHNDAPRDTLRPFVKIEMTNPIDTPTPNGILTQLTVTIYVWIALPGGTAGEPARPYDEVFKARGFITVPSLQRPGQPGQGGGPG